MYFYLVNLEAEAGQNKNNVIDEGKTKDEK